MYLFVFPFFLLGSLFTLYIFSKNDFTFIRNNISPEKVFDSFLLSSIGFFLLGRIFFALENLYFNFFNPFVFLHIIRYPGILYLGGVLGFAIVLYFRFRKKKNILHTFDIYSLSLYPMFLYFLLISNNKGIFFYFNIPVFFLSTLFFMIGIYSYRNYTLKDGSISLLFLCLTGIFTFINGFSEGTRVIFSFFSITQVLGLITFLVGAALLIIRESMIAFKRK